MSQSIYSMDRMLHQKVVVIALLAGTLPMNPGIQVISASMTSTRDCPR